MRMYQCLVNQTGGGFKVRRGRAKKVYSFSEDLLQLFDVTLDPPLQTKEVNQTYIYQISLHHDR